MLKDFSNQYLAIKAIAIEAQSTQKIAMLALTLFLFVIVSPVHAEKDHHKHQRPSFSSVDENSDGNITLNEFLKHELPHGDHETVFAKIDTDNDGLITEGEFTQHKPPLKKRGRKGSDD
jgi:Ca2+-binding EF-hand superfamily protein